MCRKLFVLTSLILVLALVSNASAALVSHYAFDETGGTYVNDSGPGGFDGALYDNAQFSVGNGVGTIAGNVGSMHLGAAYVPGESETSTNDWTDRATVPFGVSQSAGTIALWAVVNEDHYWNYYFGIKDAVNSTDRLQLVTANRHAGGTGQSSVAVGLGSDYDRVPNDHPLVAGEGMTPVYTWHHLALTWEATGGGNGNFQMYMCVAGEAGTTLVSSGSYINLTVLTQPMDIGADGDGNQKGIKGFIDDFRVYDNILSVSEINALPGVPEPATIALLGLGGLALLRKRR